ncbi:MAG: DUF2070 family protein [Thermoplasmata archaeon]
MSGATKPLTPAKDEQRRPPRGHLLFRAPPAPLAIGLILLVSAALAGALWGPNLRMFEYGLLLSVAGPALLAGVLTTPLAAAVGGRFEWHRGLFLVISVLVLELPLAVAWRGAALIWPASVPPLVFLGPFLAAPAFWFRQLGLYGVSRSSHVRMLPAALVQPGLFLAGFYVIVPPTLPSLIAGGASFVLAFICALAVLRASDRPIRREFHSSGVALIRPLLDHVADRDPAATRALEQFFLRTTVLANIRVTLVAFFRGDKVHATLALPAVHPGPFAALGASDLPRKLDEILGAAAGTVLVPHTPSDHDLDLPSSDEVARIGSAAVELLGSLPRSSVRRASPLVSPYPGSFARAQLLGDVALVLVSQAPAPTDDIAYAVGDRIVREIAREGGPPVALIDAHNSYIEGEGDISYGSPGAERLVLDVKAAVAAAQAAAVDGPIEVGVATRSGFSTARDGIGPEGMRGLVIRAAGTTTGYVLIDGNNLVVGARAIIVPELLKVVDTAEVMTTDNHVVHEVDGGINALGERCAPGSLAREARSVLEAARADLAPAEVRFGSKEIPNVKVLGPGYTARLLTSLGDTLSMFAHMFPAALLLLLTSSLVVALLLK